MVYTGKSLIGQERTTMVDNELYGIGVLKLSVALQCPIFSSSLVSLATRQALLILDDFNLFECILSLAHQVTPEFMTHLFDLSESLNPIRITKTFRFSRIYLLIELVI